MNRKNFLNIALPGSLALSLAKVLPVQAFSLRQDAASIIPPYLKKGDTIGITSPAGYISVDAIQPAVLQLKEWGFKVEIGYTIGKREHTFGGSDFERHSDFQYMMDSNHIKAILCARGGYGFVRIIDRLNFNKFSINPKWVIGFSDITVFHSHVVANYGIASIHSKMCNSFPDNPILASQIQKDTIFSIFNAITGVKMKYEAPANASNKVGTATGKLIGGNLRTLENMAGTASQMPTEGCILFLEDTGEYLYSVDRMLWNLKRTGMLEKLNGLIIGGFKNKAETAGEEFGRTMEALVLEKVKELNFPVCFDFPVGHQVNNFALKCGIQHQLTVQLNKSELIEI